MNHQVLLTAFPKYSLTCSALSFTADMSALATVSISLQVLQLLFNCYSTTTLAPFWLIQPKESRMTFLKCNMDYGIILLKSLPCLSIVLGKKFQILNTEHKVWYNLALPNVFLATPCPCLIFSYTLPCARLLSTRVFTYFLFLECFFSPCFHLANFLLIV